LGGPFAPFVLAGDAAANIVRNVWAFLIIFCGHFPDGVA
jgi:fatty acid desaturase